MRSQNLSRNLKKKRMIYLPNNTVQILISDKSVSDMSTQLYKYFGLSVSNLVDGFPYKAATTVTVA